MEESCSDDQLLYAIGSGNVSGLEALYTRYGGVTFSLAAGITGSRDVAAAIVQEAFALIWRSPSRLRPDGMSVRAWLLHLAHQKAVEHARGRIQTEERLRPRDGREDGSRDAASADGRRPTAVAACRALEALPEEQRRCLELAYFGGQTYTEIAESLAEPVDAVKRRLRLGLQGIPTDAAS